MTSRPSAKQTVNNSTGLSVSKKLKPNLNTMKKTLPTSPIGKKSFITLVQLLHIKEDNIWIAQLEKPSGSAGFMKPLVDLHLNSKANKDMNGNMDPLQMMGKSSFLLFKKQ